MGCDIHIFIEYKKGDLPWEADKHHVVEEEDEDYKRLSEVDSDGRNYDLFSRLAGVRGPGPDAKGLPKDVSEIIALGSEWYGDDGHSHSYSYLKDFEDIYYGMYEEGEEKPKDPLPIAFHEEWGKGYSWPNLIAYCHQQVKIFHDDLEAEKHLLGQDINTEVKCRLVYFFDN